MMDGTRYYLPVALTADQLKEKEIAVEAFGDQTATLKVFDVNKEEIRFYGKAPQREMIRKIWEIVESEGLQADWDESFLQMFKIALLEKPPVVNQITGQTEQQDVTDPLWRATILYQVHKAASEGGIVIAQALTDIGITGNSYQAFLGVDWVNPRGSRAKELRSDAKSVVVAFFSDRISKVETAMKAARGRFLEAADCRITWIGMLGKTPDDQWKVYLSPRGKNIKEAGTLHATYARSNGSQIAARVGTLIDGETVLENEDDEFAFRIGRPVFFHLRQ